jgi:hypothetical protein
MTVGCAPQGVGAALAGALALLFGVSPTFAQHEASAAQPADVEQQPLSESPSQRAGTQSPPQSTVRTWYGWQTLIGLGISDAFLLGAVGAAQSGGDPSAKTAALVVPGIAGNALSGPIVHWAHGHVARGFASLGLILGSGAVGAGLGAGIGAASDQGCTANVCGPSLAAIFAAVGLGIGMLAGVVVDVAVLPYEEQHK